MQGLRSWGLVLMSLAATAAGADTATPEQPSSTSFSASAGLGHESQTSPLFQLSPESTVVYLGGLQRLHGSHVRGTAQAFTDVSLGKGLSASISADATVKRALQNPDLDFSMLSVQPMLHIPLTGAGLGLGLNLMRLYVARRHFRDAQSVQATWFRPDEANLWSGVIETGTYRHQGDLTALNARASSAVLQRQIDQPLKGLSKLDISVIVGRERNDQGLRELSNRSAMLNASVQWRALGAQWTLGRGWRQAWFDDTAFVGEPVRQDRAISTDVGASWKLSERHTLLVDINDVRNVSTTRLYDNHYRQISSSVRFAW